MNNTTYQKCRPYFGPLKEESAIAFEILEKYGKPCVDAIKELREETNLSLPDCNNMLHCMYRDRELERLSAENAKLREYCNELLYMVESNDPDFLHWPELYDELQKLGVEIVRF